LNSWITISASEDLTTVKTSQASTSLSSCDRMPASDNDRWTNRQRDISTIVQALISKLCWRAEKSLKGVNLK